MVRSPDCACGHRDWVLCEWRSGGSLDKHDSDCKAWDSDINVLARLNLRLDLRSGSREGRSLLQSDV
jgi:hypothetical protein